MNHPTSATLLLVILISTSTLASEVAEEVTKVDLRNYVFNYVLRVEGAPRSLDAWGAAYAVFEYGIRDKAGQRAVTPGTIALKVFGNPDRGIIDDRGRINWLFFVDDRVYTLEFDAMGSYNDMGVVVGPRLKNFGDPFRLDLHAPWWSSSNETRP